jgi:hypothetical protein
MATFFTSATSRSLILAGMLLAAGCSKVDIDVVGQWQGGYLPDQANAVAEFKGFVQLYARGNFKLEMATDRQRVVSEGTWKQDEDRITLFTTGLDIQNPPDEDVKVLKIPILDADAIRETLGRPLVLVLKDDKKRLQGLDLRLDDVPGRLEFRKPTR